MTTDRGGRPDSQVMGILSIILFAHFFIVLLCLSGNLVGIRSELHWRLISLFAPYARTLHLDPDGARFHLTQGEPMDDNHFIEIELRDNAQTASEDIHRLPDSENRWSMHHHRLSRLATIISGLAQPPAPNDQATSTLARGVGAHFLRGNDKKFLVVRAKLHESQPMDLQTLFDGFPEDPRAENYQQIMYEADVFLTDLDQVEVVKKSSDRETATIRQSSQPQRGRNPSSQGSQNGGNGNK